jgi:hypothetical protein
VSIREDILIHLIPGKTGFTHVRMHLRALWAVHHRQNNRLLLQYRSESLNNTLPMYSLRHQALT